MKKVSLLVWIGLSLNLVLVLGSWFFTVDYQEFYDELGYRDRMSLDALAVLRYYFSVSLVLQILSVIFIDKTNKFLFVLVIISCIGMLPLSIVFFVGYRLTYNDYIYRSLKKFSLNETGKLNKYLNFVTAPHFMSGVFLTAMSVYMFSNNIPLDMYVFTLGVFQITNGIRLGNRPVIALMGDNLVFTPALMSNTYIISIEHVDLVESKKGQFKIKLNLEGLEKEITFQKNMMKNNKDSDDLEQILAKIEKNNGEKQHIFL
ncbi:hypothetical protein [Yersinia similis]|uniref:Uncharacterized protein n=2 Tax=Yersinia similis TaxID=367190 RepID=A0A0T9RNJ0_9GAMM|nr:hypothetical protein [Yersinia similis]CNB49445.1 Uncharacterised protein [Yersinia similis]CNF32830.1 Uncharacterised protein [Yersinia similis]CNG62720.1 Uncharacterised protein [Yersinia similis]CNI73783.1 Uncharacterised protein [Yersinia similis]